MPCNSDYMLPTAAERAELIGFEKALKDVCDDIIHDCDQMRELMLASGGVIQTLEPHDIAEFHLLLAHMKTLVKSSENPFNAIHQNYSYRHSNKNSAVLTLYAKVLTEVEYVLSVAQKMVDGKRPALKKIFNQQVVHRKGDIKRLIMHFASKNDFGMVAKLANVDFNFPLEDQIGFDPDKY